MKFIKRKKKAKLLKTKPNSWETNEEILKL